MKADKLADGLEKTAELNLDLVKNVAKALRQCWVVDQLDCAKYLTDEEFDQLQGLIKRVEILKNSKSKFKCWSCKKVYAKKVDEDWARWTCPLCGIETGGTGNEKDKLTGAILTLPPIERGDNLNQDMVK